MFSSELQLSPATMKLFHLEQFAIYGMYLYKYTIKVNKLEYLKI